MGERRKLKEQPWYVRLNFYAIAFAVLFFAFVVFAATRDFHPFQFYGWRNVPDTVCPLETFDSSYVSEVESGPYTVGELVGSATMLDADGQVVDTWEFEPIDLQPHPKDSRQSVAVRTAPLKPGHYRFGISGKVTGRMFFLIPTYQILDKEADQDIEVLPLKDDRCKDILRGG